MKQLNEQYPNLTNLDVMILTQVPHLTGLTKLQIQEVLDNNKDRVSEILSCPISKREEYKKRGMNFRLNDFLEN